MIWELVASLSISAVPGSGSFGDDGSPEDAGSFDDDAGPAADCGISVVDEDPAAAALIYAGAGIESGTITVLVVTGDEELEGEVTGLSGASPSAEVVDEELAAEALAGEAGEVSGEAASGAAEPVSSGAPGLAAPAAYLIASGSLGEASSDDGAAAVVRDVDVPESEATGSYSAAAEAVSAAAFAPPAVAGAYRPPNAIRTTAQAAVVRCGVLRLVEPPSILMFYDFALVVQFPEMRSHRLCSRRIQKLRHIGVNQFYDLDNFTRTILECPNHLALA
jgi:hypothetical protein